MSRSKIIKNYTERHRGISQRTTEISKEKEPKTFDDSKVIAKQGGKIAGDTRKAIEKKSGKRIVTKLNAKKLIDKE